MRKTKTSLFHSGLALLLCISMLIGSTFAWFSDSISSGKNIITAGNLDLEMYWTDDLDSGEWHNVEENGHNTIFNYDNWEPGYTDVKYIKLVNAGDLALNYKLSLTPQNGVGKLAEVINVYFAEGGVAVEQRSDLQSLRSIGLLDNVLNGGATADGTLLSADQYSPLHPSGEVVMTVAMNMLTTAGNDYMNEDAGEFTITALATQAPFEMDSFGRDYDSNAKYPAVLNSDSASATVNPVNGKVPAGGVALTGGNISAFVPEGVVLENGTTKLTLTVTPLKNTTSDITVVNGEILIPMDVHIDGVAEGNTVPIIVDLGEVLPKYLNMGNYHLYHVENGANSVMTLVADASALMAHNTFTYDPLTGEVSVAMASFSEVTMLADTAAKWDGKEDDSWYDAVKTELQIANADQLYSFAKIVGGMDADIEQDSFAGKTVKLLSDINLNHGTVVDNGIKTIFYPVGYYNSEGADHYDDKTNKDISSGFKTFEGTFDGNGHTISNIYQNTWEMKGDHDWYAAEDQHYRDGMGIFGRVYGGTIKNLTVDNFESDGEITTTGVIASYADFGATFENIAITNCNPRVYNIGNGGIVGCVGWYTKGVTDKKVTFKNITVDNSNKISALWGSYDVPCGGIVGQYYPTSGQTSAGSPKNAGIYFENCHAAAQMDVNNDVCGNYQYYAYRYAGMLIGSVRENETIDGHVYPKMDGITAEKCTVHFGTWNDYYYCEFEKNGHPSYSGPDDYKFSRVPHSELNFTDFDGNEKINTIEERNSVTGCKHVHTAAENNQAVYLPFNNLVTGYGWGVTTKVVGDMEGVTILDREEANSVEKFETKFTGDFLYRVGNKNTVSVGNLFKYKDTILAKDQNGSGVVVSVEKVDESMTVGGTFTANTTDWTKGTIQFSGTGVVKVTIQDYNFCIPTVLYVEVVDAKNITSAESSNGTSVVLLQDVKVSSNGNANYTNCTVYGNGFTFDVRGGMNQYNSKQGHGIIIIKNATLDHLRIVGDVYDEYGMYTTSDISGTPQNDYTGAIDATNSTIQNCYIANCAAPIRSNGNTIIDTTLYGGTIANLLISGGTNTLTNVTTVNYNDDRDVIGMGIVITDGAPEESTKLILNGYLKQYNYVKETDISSIKLTDAQTIFNSMFGTQFSAYHIGSNPKAVNTGIISINENISLKENVFVDNANTGYKITEEVTVTVSARGMSKNVKASVATVPSSGTVNNGYDVNSDVHVQGDYLPTFKFDLGSQMQSKDNDDDTRYLIGDVNGLTAMYPKGENALTLDLTKLATASKYEGISYSVAAKCVGPDGKEQTGTVTLDAKGTYTLIFTVEDNLFFNKNGKAITKTVERTYEVPLVLDLYEKSIADATMTISPSNLTGEYITSGSNKKYKMYPLQAIASIMDDANKDGTLETFDFKKNIQSAVLTPEGNNAFSSPTTITITYTGGQVLTIVLGTPTGLNSPGASNGGKTFSVKTDSTYGIYLQSDGAVASSSAVKGTWPLTSWSFKGTSGKVITYNTKVTIDFTKPSSGSGCVTGDTLVTLADGSKKKAKDVTAADVLLVWDFYNGKYAKVPAAVMINHGEGFWDVIELVFDDGTVVNAVTAHAFFDTGLNKTVLITPENAKDFIGHSFAKASDSGCTSVKMVDCNVVNKYTDSYSLVSAIHYNFIVEDIISYTNLVPDLFAGLEVGDNMKYDEEALKADVEKYGLYTHKDFAKYITEEQFNALNGAYMKISVGKGYVTYEEIVELIINFVK